MTMMTRTSIRSFSRWFIQKHRHDESCFCFVSGYGVTEAGWSSYRCAKCFGTHQHRTVCYESLVPRERVVVTGRRWYTIPTLTRAALSRGPSFRGRGVMVRYLVLILSSLFRRNRLFVLCSSGRWSVVQICVFYGSCCFIRMTEFSSVPTIQFPERFIAHGFCFLMVTIGTRVQTILSCGNCSSLESRSDEVSNGGQFLHFSIHQVLMSASSWYVCVCVAVRDGGRFSARVVMG